MDNKIETDFIYQSQLVRASMQNIAGELAGSPTTDKKYHALNQRLDATLKIVHTIEEQSPFTLFAKSVADSLKNEIVTLYNRVTEEWVKNKVTQIQDKAARLENSITCGKVTAEAIQNLAFHVRSFKKDHLPCRQDRRLIAQAEKIMVRAHAFLQGGDVGFEVKKSHSECKLSDEELSIEEFEEFMVIASHIHNGDMTIAQVQYNQLSDEIKKRFLEHMRQLGKEPFADAFESTQALIAMANEVVQNGEGYPTRAQIDELFFGLSQVLAEEKKDPDKIFSLRSRESLGG
jgi:hypothetical protein